MPEFDRDGHLLAFYGEGMPRAARRKSERQNSDYHIVVMDFGKRKILKILTDIKHRYRVTSRIWFSRKGNRLVTGGYRQQMQVWDLATGQNVKTFPLRENEYVSRVDYSATADLLVATTFVRGQRPRRLTFWRLDHTGQYHKIHTIDETRVVALSPDGRLLLKTLPPNIAAWDVQFTSVKSPTELRPKSPKLEPKRTQSKPKYNGAASIPKPTKSTPFRPANRSKKPVSLGNSKFDEALEEVGFHQNALSQLSVRLAANERAREQDSINQQISALEWDAESLGAASFLLSAFSAFNVEE